MSKKAKKVKHDDGLPSRRKVEKAKPPSANPYKEGSRKAEIYDVFMEAGGGEAGLKAAYKEAAAKGKKLIKEGTVKSWSSMWLRGATKPDAKPNADKPAKTPVVHDKGFHPDFKYTTRAQADRHHEALCTRVGLRAHAFHVIENDGMFAVAPANYKPGGPEPVFKVGDIVYDAYIANSKAKVIEAGPQQTVIRYVTERPKGPREECVLNRFLVKLPERDGKKRVEHDVPTSSTHTIKASELKKPNKRERARL